MLAELLELVPGGLEERDVDEATVEYALYGAAGELPDVGDVRAAAGGALVEVSTSELPDDWAERWRDWHRPLDVGAAARAAAVGAARAGALDVVIDPGQAFGTGAHPSTRLTLELLVERAARRARSPTGAAARASSPSPPRGSGFDPVLACDVERESVAATLAAAAANGSCSRRRPRGATCAARPARGRRPSSPTSCGRCCSRSRRRWSGRRSG